MPFPEFPVAVTTSFVGSDENPLSDGGKWAPIPGWPAHGAKIGGAVTGDPSDFWASVWNGSFKDVEASMKVKRFASHSYFDGQTRLHPSSGSQLRYSNRNGYVFLVNVEAGEWFIERVDNNNSQRISDVIPSSVDGNTTIGWASKGNRHSFWKRSGSGVFQKVVEAQDGTYSEGQVAIGGFGSVMAFGDWSLGSPGAAPVPVPGSSVAETLAASIKSDLDSAYFKGAFSRDNKSLAAAVKTYLQGGSRPSDQQIGANKYARARVLTEDARRKA